MYLFYYNKAYLVVVFTVQFQKVLKKIPLNKNKSINYHCVNLFYIDKQYTENILIFISFIYVVINISNINFV